MGFCVHFWGMSLNAVEQILVMTSCEKKVSSETHSPSWEALIEFTSSHWASMHREPSTPPQLFILLHLFIYFLTIMGSAPQMERKYFSAASKMFLAKGLTQIWNCLGIKCQEISKQERANRVGRCKNIIIYHSNTATNLCTSGTAWYRWCCEEKRLP